MWCEEHVWNDEERYAIKIVRMPRSSSRSSNCTYKLIYPRWRGERKIERQREEVKWLNMIKGRIKWDYVCVCAKFEYYQSWIQVRIQCRALRLADHELQGGGGRKEPRQRTTCFCILLFPNCVPDNFFYYCLSILHTHTHTHCNVKFAMLTCVLYAFRLTL